MVMTLQSLRSERRFVEMASLVLAMLRSQEASMPLMSPPFALLVSSQVVAWMPAKDSKLSQTWLQSELLRGWVQTSPQASRSEHEARV